MKRQFDSIKVLKDKDIDDVMNSLVRITQKVDGIRIYVYKIDGNLYVTYKQYILNSNEFDYNDKEYLNNYGQSQFRHIFKKIDKIKHKNIEDGTCLTFEYIMRKHTLSSNYTKLFDLVFIDSFKCIPEMKFGKIKHQYISPIEVSLEDLPGILYPRILFQGDLKNGIGLVDNLIRGKMFATDNNLSNKEKFNEYKNIFLNTNSFFGGKEEGFVIETENNVYKVQQDYQTNQEERNKIKNKYRMSKEKESLYFSEIKILANELVKYVDCSSLLDITRSISDIISSIRKFPDHEIKHKCDIKDDLQLYLKILSLKKMKGNNNALIVGKFRTITNAHFDLINRALLGSDNVNVCVISSDMSDCGQEALRVRMGMLKKLFPTITLTTYTEGKLIKIIADSPFEISNVFCGTDRMEEYNRQTKNVIGLNVCVLPRTTQDISATKVINNIDDTKYFCENTPRALWDEYDTIRKINVYN